MKQLWRASFESLVTSIKNASVAVRHHTVVKEPWEDAPAWCTQTMQGLDLHCKLSAISHACLNTYILKSGLMISQFLLTT